MRGCAELYWSARDMTGSRPTSLRPSLGHGGHVPSELDRRNLRTLIRDGGAAERLRPRAVADCPAAAGPRLLLGQLRERLLCVRLCGHLLCACRRCLVRARLREHRGG